jgi:hypothetical protein
MDRKAFFAGLLPALMLYACDRATEGTDASGETAADTEAVPVPATPPNDAPSPPPAHSGPPQGYTDGQGINEGYPDLTPAPLTPEAERTEKGARNVLLGFARAIELREYDQAWSMLGPSAKPKWSRAKFNGLFDGLRDITVAVPIGTMEGAAGSSYYTSQASITAQDQDGRPVGIEGPIVLRRVNDVDGATPEQLHWHIESADLAWTH